MTFAVLLGTLLISMAAAESGTDAADAELASRAEAAFSAGMRLREQGEHGRAEFRAAAGCYEEMRGRGMQSPDLFYNLGNAHYLAGDLPQAILSYRQGLRLAPLDWRLHRCLSEAREQVVYPADTAFGRPAPLPWFPWLSAGWLNVLLAAAVLLYALACAAVTRWLMTRGYRVLGCGLLSFLTAGCLTVLLVFAGSGVEAERTHPLVVVAADGVLLRKGDGKAFPARYDTVVNRGVEARLLFERAGWIQIELSGGEIGWVPRAQVLSDRW